MFVRFVFTYSVLVLGCAGITSVNAQQVTNAESCRHIRDQNSSECFLCRAEVAKKDETLKRESTENFDVLCREKGHKPDTKDYFRYRMDLVDLKEKKELKGNNSSVSVSPTPMIGISSNKIRYAGSESDTSVRAIESQNLLISGLSIEGKSFLVVGKYGTDRNFFLNDRELTFTKSNDNLHYRAQYELEEGEYELKIVSTGFWGGKSSQIQKVRVVKDTVLVATALGPNIIFERFDYLGRLLSRDPVASDPTFFESYHKKLNQVKVGFKNIVDDVYSAKLSLGTIY